MNPPWLCVVISKNLRGRGEDAAAREIRRLAGDSFLDFRMADDGFEGDCYSFVKCRPGPCLERFRGSAHVVAVLESYDNPSYLSDEEVNAFLFPHQEPAPVGLRYGDTVMVVGDGFYSGLYGVVVLAGSGESQVMFRFHTVTRREWIPNEELIVTGNVFIRLKLPVSRATLVKEVGKCPVVTEAKGVDTGELNRDPD